jgi:3-dehydroquinate dehydratase
VDEFKVAFKKKANGKIKEKKPSIVTLRSDKGGGKFNVTIFSLKMNIFQGFLDL